MANFDLVVHKRNKKGAIISVNPYRLLCRGSAKYYERPPGSGNLYSADGKLVKAGPEMKEAEEQAEKAKVAAENKAASVSKSVAQIAQEVQKDPVKPAPIKSSGSPK